MEAFNLKPVKLSETVYSETISGIKEARKKRDGRWLFTAVTIVEVLER